jgi:predicted Rossmann fold flavoprotein
MNNKFEIIIIGAGPAGLFAAANIKASNVLVLEKNSTAGKKLLISGSGRCNITQSGSIADFFSRYGDNHRFIIPALKEFTNIDLIEFFEERGLNMFEKKGKIFPETENSYDVLELLLNECRSKKVIINYNESVNNITYKDGSFLLTTNHEIYQCTKLVIATGGKSYPTTGSTGDGYYFSESLGHPVEKPKPALTPVYIQDYSFSELSGISLDNRKISIYRNGQKIKQNIGHIGFTHWGLSGPGILDLSRYIETGDTLKINLINQNPEILRNSINETTVNDKKLSVKKYLKNYDLADGLIKLLLTEMKIDGSSYLSNVSRTQRNGIIQAFCEYPFVVQRTGDYNIAMATKGGVSLKEVSSKTMESKLIKNLFFAGEVLDIDGDTGGYNIQAAFSTAYLAAKSISSKNQ